MHQRKEGCPINDGAVGDGRAVCRMRGGLTDSEDGLIG